MRVLLGLMVGLAIGYVALFPMSVMWELLGFDWSDPGALGEAACFQWLWLLVCALLGTSFPSRFWGNDSSSPP